MKIAFISYEFPPDTADGGIATYVAQAAMMLKHRGHQVEVFAGSRHRSETRTEEGVVVHRVREMDHRRFAPQIGPVFAERHAAVSFDVLEGPDFSADAREAVRLVPEIPLVVKLHTPSILLLELNYYHRSFRQRLIFALRALRQRRWPVWGYHPSIETHRRASLAANAVEQTHAFDADEVASPSKSLGQILTRRWGLDPHRVSTVPYPYTPSQELLDIPISPGATNVTFLGRLEQRKGVLDLARAIPAILRQFPEVRFRLVGPSDESPKPNVGMIDYLRDMLRGHEKDVEFTGSVRPDKIPGLLRTADLCVFPSLWENFPCVCLEAMSAGRAIVGTNSGGMADMLCHEAGCLIPPGQPAAIVEAVCGLLKNPALRVKLGQTARHRALENYNMDQIGARQEACYVRAITRRKAAGERSQTPLTDSLGRTVR